MPRVHVEQTKLVGKPPDVVYTILADPKHHQKILPDEFVEFKPQANGTFAVAIAFAGQKKSMVIRPEETEKNRLFRETDTLTNIVTDFVLEPHDDGTLVTIRTDYVANSSIAGFLESIFAPFFLKKLYDEELTKLCRYALIAQL